MKENSLPFKLEQAIGGAEIDFVAYAKRSELLKVSKTLIFLGIPFLLPACIFIPSSLWGVVVENEDLSGLLFGIIAVLPFLLIGFWIIRLGVKDFSEDGGCFVGTSSGLFHYKNGRIIHSPWSLFSGNIELIDENKSLGSLFLKQKNKDASLEKYVPKIIKIIEAPEIFSVEKKCRFRINEALNLNENNESNVVSKNEKEYTHLPEKLKTIIDSEKTEFIVLAGRKNTPDIPFMLIFLGLIFAIGFYSFLGLGGQRFNFFFNSDWEWVLTSWHEVFLRILVSFFYLPGALLLWNGLRMLYEKGGYFVGTNTRLIEYDKGVFKSTYWGQFTGATKLTSNSLKLIVRTGRSGGTGGRTGKKKSYYADVVYMGNVANLKKTEAICRAKIKANKISVE